MKVIDNGIGQAEEALSGTKTGIGLGFARELLATMYPDGHTFTLRKVLEVARKSASPFPCVSPITRTATSQDDNNASSANCGRRALDPGRYPARSVRHASVRVAGECGSVTEAVEALRSTQLDLVLLDVQMPDSTGFDVIRNAGPQNMRAVVFVTAYDKYAIQAFEMNAVDYLLKPFDDIRLKESIERARERLTRPTDVMRHPEALLETRRERGQYGDCGRQIRCRSISGRFDPRPSGAAVGDAAGSQNRCIARSSIQL